MTDDPDNRLRTMFGMGVLPEEGEQCSMCASENIGTSIHGNPQCQDCQAEDDGRFVTRSYKDWLNSR